MGSWATAVRSPIQPPPGYDASLSRKWNFCSPISQMLHDALCTASGSPCCGRYPFMRLVLCSVARLFCPCRVDGRTGHASLATKASCSCLGKHQDFQVRVACGLFFSGVCVNAPSCLRFLVEHLVFVCSLSPTRTVPLAHPLSTQPKQTAATRKLCKVSAFGGPRSIPVRRRVSLALCTLSCACRAVIPGVSSRHDGSVNGGHRRVRSVDTAATKETLAVRKGVLAPQYVHVLSLPLSSMCLQVGS